MATVQAGRRSVDVTRYRLSDGGPVALRLPLPRPNSRTPKPVARTLPTVLARAARTVRTPFVRHIPAKRSA